MKFTARFFAISAAISQVLALPTLTDSSYDVVEGQPFSITWSNATGSVTLELKNGASTDLKTVSTIASGLTGTSYTWTPTGLASDTYAISITDSTGTNYSPQFTYAGTGTTTATTSSASAATTATGSTSTDSTMTTTTSENSSATPVSSTASGFTNSTTTASSTKSTSTSKSTGTSSSSSSGSTSTPINTNDSKKLGSSLAFVILTAAALMVCQ